MRIVYHTHYLDYFEVARTEALRAAGLVYKEMEDGGIIMPVVDLSVRYHRSARYDDLLEIRTTMTLSPSGTRVQFDYETRRKDEEALLVSAQVTLCFFDVARDRPVRAPEYVHQIIARAGTQSTA